MEKKWSNGVVVMERWSKEQKQVSGGMEWSVGVLECWSGSDGAMECWSSGVMV